MFRRNSDREAAIEKPKRLPSLDEWPSRTFAAISEERAWITGDPAHPSCAEAHPSSVRGAKSDRGKIVQTLRHHYVVTGVETPDSDPDIFSDRLPVLRTALPAEFGGTGEQWSPETLLVAAVADCFLLTFRGLSRAQQLRWISIRCEVVGRLDRVERLLQFTEFCIRARLELPPGMNESLAKRVLERAENTCLITNSLKASCRVEATIETADLQAV
jgi:organic hydroperoxide reductase OsmC/OhrA